MRFHFFQTLFFMSIFSFPVPLLAEDCTTRKASIVMVAKLLEPMYSSILGCKEVPFEAGKYMTRTIEVGICGFEDGLYCVIDSNGIGDSSEFYIAKVDCYDLFTDDGIESFDIKFERSWPMGSCELDYERTKFGRHITLIL